MHDHIIPLNYYRTISQYFYLFNSMYEKQLTDSCFWYSNNWLNIAQELPCTDSDPFMHKCVTHTALPLVIFRVRRRKKKHTFKATQMCICTTIHTYFHGALGMYSDLSICHITDLYHLRQHKLYKFACSKAVDLNLFAIQMLNK